MTTLLIILGTIIIIATIALRPAEKSTPTSQMAPTPMSSLELGVPSRAPQSAWITAPEDYEPDKSLQQGLSVASVWLSNGTPEIIQPTNPLPYPLISNIDSGHLRLTISTPNLPVRVRILVSPTPEIAQPSAEANCAQGIYIPSCIITHSPHDGLTTMVFDLPMVGSDIYIYVEAVWLVPQDQGIPGASLLPNASRILDLSPRQCQRSLSRRLAILRT